MRIKPTSYRHAALIQLDSENLPVRAFSAGYLQVSASFAILCGAAVLYRGGDEIFSWADGNEVLWRYFDVTPGTNIQISTQCRGYIACSIAVQQLTDDPLTSNAKVIPAVPGWLQGMKVAFSDGWSDGSFAHLTAAVQSPPVSWWDVSAGATFPPSQNFDLPTDVMYDRFTEATTNTGTNSLPKWNFGTVSGMTQYRMNLFKAANAGDASYGYLGQTNNTICDADIGYFVFALTKGLTLTSNAAVAIDPTTNPAGLLGYVLVGPILGPNITGLNQMYKVAAYFPQLAPTGVWSLPYGADQIAFGCLIMGTSGALGSTVEALAGLCRFRFSRNSQQGIGTAPKSTS